MYTYDDLDKTLVSEDATSVVFSVSSEKYRDDVAPWVDSGGAINEYMPTEREYVSAVQNHLDSQARSMGYDSVFTAVTYAEEGAVTEFQQDGKTLRAWRSLVWGKCYSVLAEVQAGSRGALNIGELIGELPTYDG